MVGSAVLSGKEEAVNQALASGKGDLKVCVPTPYNIKQTCSLLTLAAQKGHVHLLPFLLDAGLSVQGHGTSSWTPLMVAAKEGHSDMVKALLDSGAKENDRNDKGKFTHMRVRD